MSLRSFLLGTPGDSISADAPFDIKQSWRTQHDWAQLSHYIAHEVLTRDDETRRKAAYDRLRLYGGGGVELAEAMVNDAFHNDEVRALRIALVKYARSHNLLRRLVDERARVYAKPPRTRKVGKGNRAYQELQALTDHNAALRWADTRLTLNNDVLVMFRVRATDVGPAPRIDVLGPEDFTPIADPRDPTRMIGVIISQVPSGTAKATDPHYLCWSPWESFQIDRDKRIIVESIEPNPFGVIPGLLIGSAYRATSLLDPLSGEDMVAAHLSVWLLRTIALKEAKSQNVQAAFMGETGRIATGQAQDSSRDMTLPEGIGVTSIRRGVDVQQFLTAADHIEERCAATYGIPPTVLRHAGATSGYEIDLRRIPLEELREDRIQIWRRAERRLAEVQSIVVARDLPSLAFDASSWSIDFAEIKRPLTAKETYEVRQAKRASGHSNPVSEAMEDNPDLDETQAQRFVMDNVTAWAMFIEAVRALNVRNDATATTPGQSPEDNGAQRADTEDDEEKPSVN